MTTGSRGFWGNHTQKRRCTSAGSAVIHFQSNSKSTLPGAAMKLRNSLPIVLIFWLAVLTAALLFTRRPAAEPIQIIPPPTPAATSTAEPSPTPQPTATPRPLRVDVIGAVLAPGVQTLPPGSIVDDAIRAAGGPSPDADLERVNKATELQDGAQVYVPRRSDPAGRPVLSAPVPSPTPQPTQDAPQRSAPAIAPKDRAANRRRSPVCDGR